MCRHVFANTAVSVHITEIMLQIDKHVRRKKKDTNDTDACEVPYISLGCLKVRMNKQLRKG